MDDGLLNKPTDDAVKVDPANTDVVDTDKVGDQKKIDDALNQLPEDLEKPLDLGGEVSENTPSTTPPAPTQTPPSGDPISSDLPGSTPTPPVKDSVGSSPLPPVLPTTDSTDVVEENPEEIKPPSKLGGVGKSLKKNGKKLMVGVMGVALLVGGLLVSKNLSQQETRVEQQASARCQGSPSGCDWDTTKDNYCDNLGNLCKPLYCCDGEGGESSNVSCNPSAECEDDGGGGNNGPAICNDASDASACKGEVVGHTYISVFDRDTEGSPAPAGYEWQCSILCQQRSDDAVGNINVACGIVNQGCNLVRIGDSGSPEEGDNCSNNDGVFRGDCIIVYCPNGDTGGSNGSGPDGKCDTEDTGAYYGGRDRCDNLSFGLNECGQIDPVTPDGRYCQTGSGHFGIKLDNCGGTPPPSHPPTPSPTPTPTPTPNPELSCVDLDDAGGNLTLGDTATFTCEGSFSSIDEPAAFFRYNVDGGAYTTSAAIPIVSSTASYDVSVDKIGDWTVQCRVCEDSAGTSCTTWGKAN